MEEDGQCPFCMTVVKAGASICPSCNAKYGVSPYTDGVIMDPKVYEVEKKVVRKMFLGSLVLFAVSLLLGVVTGAELFIIGILLGGIGVFTLFKRAIYTIGDKKPAWFR